MDDKPKLAVDAALVTPQVETINEKTANTTPIDARRWIKVFAETWLELEPDPEDLDMGGFKHWGPVLYEQHKNDDPAALATKLFPSAGDYFEILYPSYERQPDSKLS